MELSNQEGTDRILAELEGETFTVGAVKKGVRRKSPAPPFSTSTLQQEASRKLGFQARRTMKAAQELYEGVEVAGMGAVGLITYMRTDSLRISDEAQADAAKYIGDKFGSEYLPPSKRVYKSKSNAQDGHEAIRPTMIEMSPDKVKDSLSADQYKLYKLIWERFLASQMANALYNTVAADIHAGKYLFKASGFSVKFDGFTTLYEDGPGRCRRCRGQTAAHRNRRLPQGKVAGRQPALHPAAGPVHRSLPHQNAGGERHRPSEHLCPHHHHYSGPRVHRAGAEVAQAHHSGRGDHQVDGGAIPEHRQCKVHRHHGEEPGRSGGGQDRLGQHPERILR